ncbi:FecCD family ABC transporter permease [Pseudalkalibacillus salsuginis]|uniref:FecCD family ABC transporter permease n=1 Tax=Pseudalkalibacillus salsuginis TaxID=2910972 RepID=UPI001F16505B|nr:iron ABC transporter permease [Pseudalkalibacillus salsuginis]MCF6411759.1 iron ABC transporter permease [Pseudalkalibacillus salsuginis]
MRELLRTNLKKWIGFITGILLVVFFIGCSIVYGYTSVNWGMVVASFTQFDGSNAHIIIQESRVPRALIGAAVGASLAIAGALMQGITRNPLASPSIFGINAGAGFFIVLAVTLFSISSIHQFAWIAFFGAMVTSLIVYFLGSLGRDGLTPVKLTLAGAAMAAMFASLTQGMLALDEKALEEVLFWLTGSIEGRKLGILTAMLPYLIAGWLGSLMITGQMNTLSMGDDVAAGLGQNTALVKISAAVVIVLLAGSAVAIAGPIGFIGIVIPHIARGLVGIDYRWIIPYSGLLGAILLLLADIGARYIIMPKEVPVGVMTALIGTPFFIYIARRGLNKL